MNESNSLHIYSFQRSKYINLLQGSSRFIKYREKNNITSEYAKIFSLFLILLIKTISLYNHPQKKKSHWKYTFPMAFLTLLTEVVRTHVCYKLSFIIIFQCFFLVLMIEVNHTDNGYNRHKY